MPQPRPLSFSGVFQEVFDHSKGLIQVLAPGSNANCHRFVIIARPMKGRSVFKENPAYFFLTCLCCIADQCVRVVPLQLLRKQKFQILKTVLSRIPFKNRSSTAFL